SRPCSRSSGTRGTRSRTRTSTPPPGGWAPPSSGGAVRSSAGSAGAGGGPAWTKTRSPVSLWSLAPPPRRSVGDWRWRGSSRRSGMKVRGTLSRALVALLFTLGAAVATAQDADTSAVLNLATNADPTLNPWTPGAVIESNQINTILFEQLTRYSPEDLTPSPMLATSWQAEEGALASVVALRQGVVWSDGDPSDAADVAFTFNDVVLNPDLGAQSASQFSAIDRVEVIDDHTVRFVLNEPFSALPYYLASFAGIIPVHVLGEAENPL